MTDHHDRQDSEHQTDRPAAEDLARTSEQVSTAPSSVDDEGYSTLTFRDKAVRGRSHPEQLDSMLQVVSPISWAMLSGLLLLIALAVIWAFFGSLPLNVEGRGIFMSKDGAVTLQTTIEGIVKVIHIAPGDLVEKGTLLAEVYDPREELKLRAAETKASTLEQNYMQLQQDIAVEEKAIKSAIESEILAKKYSIDQKKRDGSKAGNTFSA